MSILSLSFSTDPLRLNLGHQFLLERLELLLCGVLHVGLGSRDASAVFPILVVSTKDPVPPSKRGGVVVHEGHMVEIVVLGARPEGNDIMQRPGEI